MTRAVQPWLAAALVGSYAAAWRAYGVFDLADEGTLLMQAWRVAHGQRLHADFDSGFGALYFMLQARLVTAGGLAAVRWALVATQAASAGLVFVLARRLAGPALAWAAVAVLVAFFLPVSPSQGAPFLMPYPAWYVSALCLLAVVLLDDTSRTPPWRAAVVGGLAGIAFAFKPNAGVLLAAGSATALAATTTTSPRLRVAVLAASAVMVLALFGTHVAPLGLGLVGLVLAVGAYEARRPRDARALAALLGGGVLVGGALQLGPLVELGWQRYAHEVLLLGAGVAEVYAMPYPLAATVGVIAGAIVALVRSRRLASVVGATALAIVAVTTLHGASAAPDVRLAAESFAFCGVMLAVAAGIRGARVGHEALLAPAVVAGFVVAQLHPRPDFVHLLEVAPITLALMAWAWGRAARGASVAVLVGVPLLACAGRMATVVPVLANVTRGDVTSVVAGETRLVSVAPQMLRSLATVVDAVRARTGPRDPVLAFPACALATFLADRPPVGPFDYFFPGRPTRAEVTALVERLATAPPRVAVTCTAAGSDLAGAWHAYPEMGAFLSGRYRVVVEAPPFTVLEARP